MPRLHRGVPQAVRRYLLIAEVPVQSRFTSFEIRGRRSGIGAGFSPSFFGFPLLVIIRPLFYTDLSPPPPPCGVQML
jgi:hypothetical protein